MEINEHRSLISIIVPVYNVELYITKCIDSIICQTHSNLDIILINDGSIDLSGEICDKYAQYDSRIRVVHKQNGGQSQARNVGLSMAKGDYIGFVDSDDYIEPNMYEKLLYYMKVNHSDIVECGVKNIYSDGVVYEESNQVFCYSGKEALEKHLKEPNSSKSPRAAVWSKLFKTSIIKDIQFPEGKIHEDFYFTYRSLINAKKYCWVDCCLYCHIYTNMTSTTQLPFSKRDFAKLDIFKERMDYLLKYNMIDLARYAERNYYIVLLQFFYRASYHDMIKEANAMKQLIKKYKRNVLFSNMSLKKKLEFFVFSISPSSYLKIRTIIMGKRR